MFPAVRSVAFVLALLTVAVRAQTSSVSDIVGTYIQSTGFTGASYTLKSDLTYQYSWGSDCCNTGGGQRGIFSLNGDLVHFKPTWITEGIETITESRAADPKRDSEFDMYLVRWEGRRYLVKDGHLPEFAAAVNFGEEPRTRRYMIKNSDWLATHFYVRDDATKLVVSGVPSMPKGFEFLIPPRPIDLVITKVESLDKHIQVTAKRPKTGDIRPGMCFIGKQKYTDYDVLLWITSVDQNSVVLQDRAMFSPPPKYRFGDILTTNTKYRRDER